MVEINTENNGMELVNPYQVVKVFQLGRNARRLQLIDGSYVVTNENMESLKKKLLV